MEVVEKLEIYLEPVIEPHWTDNEVPEPEYFHSLLLLRQGDQFYYAKTRQPNVDKEDVVLDDVEFVPIPEWRVWPIYQHRFMIASEPLPEDCYVKTPNLLLYDEEDKDDIVAECLIQELEVYEVLRKFPHPNIAEYYGCVVRKNRIRGICLAKYDMELNAFLEQSDSMFDREGCWQQVREGVRHLHKLGFVHGDLNPSNIMMAGNVPVIIDFDSCCRKGHRLGHKSATPGWYMAPYGIAEVETDHAALEKLRKHILSCCLNSPTASCEDEDESLEFVTCKEYMSIATDESTGNGDIKEGKLEFLTARERPPKRLRCKRWHRSLYLTNESWP